MAILYFYFTVLRNTDSDLAISDWSADSLSLGKNIFTVLEDQGAESIRLLNDYGNVPYVFIYQKGNGLIAEGIALSIDETINVESFIPIKKTEGELLSTRIGPSASWDKLHWSYERLDLEASDQAFVQVLGIDNEQGVNILIDSLYTSDTTLSLIDASQFPYLQLKFKGTDEQFRTAPQLKNWIVNYQGCPDVAIAPNINFTLLQDTIAKGELLQIGYAVENINAYPMDSLLVKITLQNNLNEELTFYDRLAPIAGFGSLTSEFSYTSNELSGPQRVIIELNPDNDQKERFTFNNILNKSIFVQEDKINPLLHVTFDGRVILDGDLVSSSPNIAIEVKDENPYIPISDTSLFNIAIEDPKGNIIPLRFEDENVQFSFSPEENKSTIQYQPNLTLNGIYHLVVRARDAANNLSGAFDYKVSFEVITESSISNILNYPNPFSTFTHFVYTLTGNTPPAWFKIQIMTVSGRIVRELTQSDLGPLEVGTHQTAFAWDGTDEYGDPLANGVYLYKIVAQDSSGENFEQYETGTNSYFKKGIGKMVILR